MRQDRFTIKAQEALQAAQELAAQNGQQEILPEHLLGALLEQPEGIVPLILQKLGASVELARAEARRALDRLPKVAGAVGGDRLSARMRTLLEAAWNEAQRLRDEYVSTEHLMLAIAAEQSGAAGQILRQAGAGHDSILQALVDVRG